MPQCWTNTTYWQNFNTTISHTHTHIKCMWKVEETEEVVTKSFSHCIRMDVRTKMDKITLHLNGICRHLLVDGVFAIINHWLLHQAVKRLNKTNAICFPLLMLFVRWCSFDFFSLFLSVFFGFFASVPPFYTGASAQRAKHFIHRQQRRRRRRRHHHHYYPRFMAKSNPNHMRIIFQPNLGTSID